MADRALRRVIVNADDFGLTSGVNRAVRDGHRDGVLTSATLLVTGNAPEEAAEIAREFPELSVGLHVNFTLPPVSDPANIRTLVDDEGRFVSDRDMLRGILTRKVSAAEVYREVSAQVELLKSMGVTPTHWDAHRSVAFWPGLCSPASRAAYDGGIRRVRTPRVWVVEPGQSPAAARWRWRLRRPAVRFGTEANRFVARRTLQSRFTLPGRRLSAGLVTTQDDYEERWKIAFANVPPETCEMVSHPAYVDDELRALTPKLTSDREVDLRVLLDEQVAASLREAGAQLCSFRDL